MQVTPKCLFQAAAFQQVIAVLYRYGAPRSSQMLGGVVAENDGRKRVWKVSCFVLGIVCLLTTLCHRCHCLLL